MNNYRQKTEETFKRMTHGQQTTYGTIQRIVENNLQKSLEEKVKESNAHLKNQLSLTQQKLLGIYRP